MNRAARMQSIERRLERARRAIIKDITRGNNGKNVNAEVRETILAIAQRRKHSKAKGSKEEVIKAKLARHAYFSGYYKKMREAVKEKERKRKFGEN